MDDGLPPTASSGSLMSLENSLSSSSTHQPCDMTSVKLAHAAFLLQEGLYFLSNMPRFVKTLIIVSTTVPFAPKHADSILQTLAKNATLSELKLVGPVFDHSVLAKLCEVFKSRLPRSHSGDSTSSSPSPPSQDTGLVSLSISNGVLGDRGVDLLVHALKQMPTTLACLSLQNNNIRTDGFKRICELLAQEGLRTLDLSRNPIGAHGAHECSRSFSSVTLSHLTVMK
jgi:hypothetical protein